MFLLPAAWFVGGLTGQLVNGIPASFIPAVSFLLLGVFVATDMRVGERCRRSGTRSRVDPWFPERGGTTRRCGYPRAFRHHGNDLRARRDAFSFCRVASKIMGSNRGPGGRELGLC